MKHRSKPVESVLECVWLKLYIYIITYIDTHMDMIYIYIYIHIMLDIGSVFFGIQDSNDV